MTTTPQRRWFNSKSDLNAGPPQAIRPIQALIGLELGLFVVGWIAFGLIAFMQIRDWGTEYDRKVAAVTRGDVQPETLHVLGIREKSSESEDIARWVVVLGDKENENIVASRRLRNPNTIDVGSEVIAYRFGNSYLIPRFDRGGHNWGKWAFLAVGLLPIPIVCGIVLFRVLRRRRISMQHDSVASPQNP